MERRKFIKNSAMAGVALGLPHINPAGPAGPAASDRKFFVFSRHLQWLGYEEMARTAAEIGFDGVDLTVRPGGHVLPENVESDLPRAVEAIRKHGLIADTITTAITSVNDPGAEDIINTAAQLGIKQYRCGWIKYKDPSEVATVLEQARDQLMELAELNSYLEIRADYQNHEQYFGASIWDLLQVLEEIGSEWLGCRYDIRHAMVESTQSWPFNFHAIAPWIRSLDVKDFTWNREDLLQVEDTPIGGGLVDFERYAELVTDNQITGNITMHFEYPLGGAEDGNGTLTVPPGKVTDAMKKDLSSLKSHFLNR